MQTTIFKINPLPPKKKKKNTNYEREAEKISQHSIQR